MKNLFYDQEFQELDFSTQKVDNDFEECTFTHCNFSESNLGGISFINCTFIDCNLSNAVLRDTSFQEVHFQHCKMLGLKLNACSNFLLSFNFDNCVLDFSSFYQINLSTSQFNACSLKEVDFTQANLSGISLADCNLTGASFEDTNLQRANLSFAYGFSIDPELNKIKQATFSRDGLPGLLIKYKLNIEG